ncbi:MAG: hypothetical protein ABH821_01245 [archaeon]
MQPNFSRAVKQQLKETLSVPAKTVFENLTKRLFKEGWDIVYSDSILDQNKKLVCEVFGVSSAFGGSTLLSLGAHGARYVPFFVKVKEIDSTKSEVHIISGGSESWLGLDFGRNRKIVENLLKYCE